MGRRKEVDKKESDTKVSTFDLECKKLQWFLTRNWQEVDKMVSDSKMSKSLQDGD